MMVHKPPPTQQQKRQQNNNYLFYLQQQQLNKASATWLALDLSDSTHFQCISIRTPLKTRVTRMNFQESFVLLHFERGTSSHKEIE